MKPPMIIPRAVYIIGEKRFGSSEEEKISSGRNKTCGKH
jgi:hypothetical protein